MVQLILNYLIAFVALSAIYLGCSAAIELAQGNLHARMKNTAARSPRVPRNLACANTTPHSNAVMMVHARNTASQPASEFPEKIARIAHQQALSANAGSVILF